LFFILYISLSFSCFSPQLRSLKDDCTGQIRTLNDKLSFSCSQEEKARAELGNLRADRDQTILKLKMDNDYATRELGECKHLRDQAMTEANEAKNALDRALEEAESLRERGEELEEELKRRKGKMGELDKKVEQLQGKCDDLTAEYCKRVQAMETRQSHEQQGWERKEEELR